MRKQVEAWERSELTDVTAKVLRVFLRFLIAKGQCAVGLDDAIPTLAHWRLASLPRYLAPEDVERLIASSVDRRDRADFAAAGPFGSSCRRHRASPTE